VVARDIRRHDRPADHPPRKLVAGEEIIALGLRPAPRGDEADAEHREHVEDEDAEVEGGESHAVGPRCTDEGDDDDSDADIVTTT
jgi:hypothetical protein